MRLAPAIGLRRVAWLIGVWPLFFLPPTSEADYGEQVQPETKLRQGLEEAGRRLLSAVENADARMLARTISPRGIQLGIDSQPVRLSIIRRQMLRREGFYCRMFDTECLLREDRTVRNKNNAAPRDKDPFFLSYRDLILKSSRTETRFGISRLGNNWLGNMQVRLNVGTLQEYELSFEFENVAGNWRLNSLPEY